MVTQKAKPYAPLYLAQMLVAIRIPLGIRKLSSCLLLLYTGKLSNISLLSECFRDGLQRLSEGQLEAIHWLSNI